MKSTKIMATLGVAAGILMAGSTSASAAIELRFGHGSSTTSYGHLSAVEFKKYVEGKSGGDLGINIYPAIQLGKGKELLTGTRLGTIDMTMAGNPWMTGFNPVQNVLDIPFIFDDHAHVYRVLVGEWMNAGGITRRIVEFANALVGHIRGGITQANLVSREPWALLLMLNVSLLVIGLFLENIPSMVIMVPIFFPIAVELGIDPIHFGIVVVASTLIGLCTPPVGILIYMSANIAKVGSETVIKESLPFVAVLIAVVLLVTFFPALTLTLPNLVF